jgi:transcriptional regulator with XRE-family HTH domain
VARSFSGVRLRSLREAANLRREALAVAVDRSFSSVVKWERDENVPTARDLGCIAEALGCGVEEFYADQSPAGAVA